MDLKKINYGTVLKAYIVDKKIDDLVLLIDNSTGGNGFDCCVLDLETKEILTDCKNIKDFIKNYKIKEIVGDLDELLVV